MGHAHRPRHPYTGSHFIQMAREFRLDDGQATDPNGHGANAGPDEEDR